MIGLKTTLVAGALLAASLAVNVGLWKWKGAEEARADRAQAALEMQKQAHAAERAALLQRDRDLAAGQQALNSAVIELERMKGDACLDSTVPAGLERLLNR